MVLHVLVFWRVFVWFGAYLYYLRVFVLFWGVFVLLARICVVWRAIGNTAQQQVIDIDIVIFIIKIFLTS